MEPLEDSALRQARSIGTLTSEQFSDVRALIAADLGRGRDAWPTVAWLAATNDQRAKRMILEELELIIGGSSSELLSHEAAVDNFSSDVVFGRATIERRRISRAFDFATAIRRSLTIDEDQDDGLPPPPKPGDRLDLMDLGYERVIDRRRAAADRQAAREDELQRLGVEPGGGIPYWEMYMRRRRHKSWG